jgi:hypothetical protein
MPRWERPTRAVTATPEAHAETFLTYASSFSHYLALCNPYSGGGTIKVRDCLGDLRDFPVDVSRVCALL